MKQEYIDFTKKLVEFIENTEFYNAEDEAFQVCDFITENFPKFKDYSKEVKDIEL